MRNRNAEAQAKMIKDSAIAKWGTRAWSQFSDREREEKIAVEFMALFVAQEVTGSSPLDHYRTTAQLLAHGEI